ncbi:hypothetical protein JG688_00014381 [Phytophthora aleatoria]|uniref:Uncharacterized protein n=1 Tax=Phytophthora aleatoria TaxID=2496075 RepID=A0A8J5LXL0_9STRA|nr:hypothetical protein JG688_00014381 [Phytophthora aleatoria]
MNSLPGFGSSVHHKSDNSRTRLPPSFAFSTLLDSLNPSHNRCGVLRSAAVGKNVPETSRVVFAAASFIICAATSCARRTQASPIEREQVLQHQVREEVLQRGERRLGGAARQEYQYLARPPRDCTHTPPANTYDTVWNLAHNLDTNVSYKNKTYTRICLICLETKTWNESLCRTSHVSNAKTHLVSAHKDHPEVMKAEKQRLENAKHFTVVSVKIAHLQIWSFLGPHRFSAAVGLASFGSCVLHELGCHIDEDAR